MLVFGTEILVLPQDSTHNHGNLASKLRTLKNNGVFNFEGIHWVILSPGPARGIVSPGKLTPESWLFLLL